MILERIINNHILQLETKGLNRDYKIFLYGWTLKYMRKVKRDAWSGEMMSRLYQIANVLDGVDSTWREVSYKWKK